MLKPPPSNNPEDVQRTPEERTRFLRMLAEYMGKGTDSFLVLGFKHDEQDIASVLALSIDADYGGPRASSLGESIRHLLDLDIICDSCFGLHDHTEGGTKKGH